LIYSFAQRPAPVSDGFQSVAATPDQPLEPREATPDLPSETRAETQRFLFLNDHPVLQLIYDQLTDEFFEQTGIRMVTVSSEANLEGQSPVLFSLSGGVPQWPCLDLSDTVAFANLACDCFTLKQADRVIGIANEVEPFGLIFNAELLARVGYTAMDLNSFSDLKAVAAYITQNQDTLGFGAFATPEEALMATVLGNAQRLWELTEHNPAPGALKEEKAVFELGTLSDMERLSASGDLQLDMLPLYTGAEGEETQGMHCFIKRYWCVREDATEAEIQAALAFLNFLVSPRTDGTVPVDDLALLAPYRQAVYARNSVQQRLRNDIALGKKCIVCDYE
jgi:raffinose/stachyose/melibiose transport system substrate-binding protein